MAWKNDKTRYQTGRYENDGEHVQTDHRAKFVRVLAPDGKTSVDVAYIGGGQFHIHTSSRAHLTADSSNDYTVRVQRTFAPKKNVARKG